MTADWLRPKSHTFSFQFKYRATDGDWCVSKMVWGQGAMWWWRSTFISVWRRQYEPKVRRTKTAFQSSVRSRRHVMMRRSEASHMEHAGQSSSFFHRRSRHDMFYSGNFICPHAFHFSLFFPFMFWTQKHVQHQSEQTSQHAQRLRQTTQQSVMKTQSYRPDCIRLESHAVCNFDF